MKSNIIKGLQFLLFLSIGLGILYYLYYTSNASYQEQLIAEGKPPQDYLVKLGQDFAGVNYFWIGMVVLVYLASNVSRAIRWKMLLDPLKTAQGDGVPKVRFHNAFFATLINYVVNSVFPRAGEVARCGVIRAYEGISLEKVLGTVFLDRVLDVVMLALMMGLALLLEFDNLWGYLSENAFQSEDGQSSGLPIWIWIGMGVILLCGILFFVFRKQLMQTAMYKKIESLVMGFVAGLRSIQQLNNPLAFVAHTIFIWLMYYLMLYLAFFAFAPTEHLSMSAGLLVFVFGALGIVVPSPGGIGSYQFFVSTALVSFYSLNQADALSFANIAFAAPFLCNIIFGILAFVLLPVFNGGKKS